MKYSKYPVADGPWSALGILFLHGFPGRYTKNEDLAAKLAAELNATCYLPTYPGLGSRAEEFLFSKCIEETDAFLHRMRGSFGHEHVAIIAHSWGAFVAKSVLERDPNLVDRLIFLAPLSQLPPISAFGSLLQDFVSEQKRLGYPAEENRLTKDYLAIQSRDDSLHRTGRFNVWPPTLVIQGTHDAVTSLETNEAYFADDTDRISFVPIADNHWLTDRQKVASLALQFLKI